MSTVDRILWCEACGLSFAVPALAPARSLGCARCRTVLAPGTDAAATTVWLYAASTGTSAAPTLDDARTTWSEVVGSAAEAPRRLAHYALLDELGRGGMGAVYRALDERNGDHVALKVLLGGRWADRRSLERFLREIAAASRLRHPALARVVEAGTADGQPWYAMELVVGPSLRDVLDGGGRLPADEALRIAAALAHGLQHAHEHGVSHRDVKPENVLLRVTGEPVLTDFGLVLEHQHARLTHSGQVMGTPAYLPPELARADKDVAWPLVDVYALGAVLYEMLAGRPAYPGDSGMQVLSDVIAGPPAPLASLVPSLPPGVAGLVERAMARVPAARFPDARTFAGDLERAARGEPIASRGLSLGYRARLAWERHRRPATGALLALGAVVTGLGTWGGADALRQRRATASAWSDAASRWSQLDPQLAELEEAGRTGEVDAAFASFVDGQPARDAPALVAARRTQATRLRARGDYDGELDLLAAAWVEAADGDAEATARVALLDGLAARWWYHRIETLAATARQPDPTLLVTAATARRDLAATRAAWDLLPDGPPPTRGTVEAALTGRPTTWRARGAQPMSGDRLLLVTDQGLVVVAAAPDLPVQGTLSLGREAAVVLPVADDRVLTWGDDRAELLVRDGDGAWSVGAAWPESRVLDAVELPIPGDPPRRSVIVAVGPYGRQLWRLDEGPDGWVRSPAHDGTAQAASDAVDVGVGDVDADGAADVLVAMGPWNAFDVRWLEADPGGELTLRARRKLGFTSGLALATWGSLPVVAAMKSDRYPSRRTFPASHPFGDPAGLYLLDPATGLTTVLHRRMVGPVDQVPPSSGRPLVVDVDGDGRDDVVSSWTTEGDHPWLLIWRQGVDGAAQHVRIEGLHLLGAIQADQDPARELVVGLSEAWSDAAPAVWVLGVGDQPLPPLPRAAFPHDPAPRGADADTANRWARIDHLAAAGLFQAAARRYDAEGERATGALADAARLRAARMWLAAGAPERAASIAARVTGDADQAAALDLRASAELRAYRFADAAETDRLLAARPDRDETIRVGQASRAPLLAHARAPDEVALGFEAPLDPRWVIHEPLAVRRDPRAGGLRVDVVVGSGAVAELPLERTGDQVGLEVAGTLHRVEWAAGIAVLLEPPDGDPAGARFAGWGGGSLLERQVGCEVPGRGLVGPRAPGAPSAPQRFVVRIELVPTLHELRCVVEDGEGRRLHDARSAFDRALPPGAWRLVIRSAGEESVNTPMHAAVTLDRVTIRGFRVTGEPTPEPTRAYAEGDLAEVLASEPPVGPVLAAAALAELGRVDEAAERLANTAPEVGRQLALLARSRPALATELRGAFGDRWFTTWHAAWSVAVNSHPDDPVLHERIRADLSGLEAWRPTDLAEQTARAELLAARGRARWVGGATQAARDDLNAATEAALPGIGAGVGSARQVWLDAHATLAAIALADGDPVTGRRHAEAALRHAPFRELALDRLVLEPRIAALRDDPLWMDLLAGAEPPPAPTEAGR